MNSLYPKLPGVSRALRNRLLKSFSQSAKKPSQTAAKSVTKKTSKSQKAVSGGDGCSKSSVKVNYIVDKCDMFDKPKGHSKPYRMLSYCIIPLIVTFAYHLFSHHEEHDVHYVPYEYMYKRTKKFFWGDHRKSFFHGPNNLIPDEEAPRYKKLPDAGEEDLKRRKELRDLHAKEELERRTRRREQEALK